MRYKLAAAYTAGVLHTVLRSLIGVPLERPQENLILQKYGVSDNKYINWREFVGAIEGKCDENDFSLPPGLKVLQTIESLNVGTKSLHHLPGDEKFDCIRPLLSRIHQFNEYQGYIIRDCYRQYDKHNMGLVTESQFFRGFPGPKDINDEEILLLVQRYQSSITPGFVNYLAFENDVRMVGNSEKTSKDGVPPGECKESGLVYRKEDLLNPSQHMIVDRIKVAVYNRGIRVLDFFVDYDKLRHDEVTQHQFMCALLSAVGKEARLNCGEVQMLANYYRSKRNPQMVNYREFCREIDSPFHTLQLEKDPLKQISMPPTGALSKALCMLNPEEEDLVSKLLGRIKNEVREKRILTFPYFRDYDMGTCFSGFITGSQFERVLHFLGLNASKEDCRQLLDDWYTAAAPVSLNEDNPDDVNFEKSTVDKINCVPEIGDTLCGKNAARRNWCSTITPIINSDGDKWPAKVFLDRIRHLTLVNRIPLKPWFYDFDHLRSGYVTRSQFERCLTAAGLTRLGLHDLTPTQVNTLADNYMSPADPNTVNWMKFVNDVDTVFTIPELEKQPLTRVLPQETFIQPKPGTADWSTATAEMIQNYESGMAVIRRKVNERRMLLLPDFTAFDPHKTIVSKNATLKILLKLCPFHKLLTFCVHN
ncbi:unnamed protein product [Heterobilharzia americana]|nr:unnamed protein product [Heterobilharzia americana]